MLCFNSRIHVGCDRRHNEIPAGFRRFNSRTHAGCDLTDSQITSNNLVSIHAPTRGATKHHDRPEIFRVCFNSRTHAGCDRLPSLVTNGNLRFQFTHPRGVRHIKKGSIGITICFNSRTHAGCDPMPSKTVKIGAVSIHAPTRGATSSSGGRLKRTDVSIHAPTRGATIVRFIMIGIVTSFNSRTHAGCGVGRERFSIPVKGFNSRTHAGCDIYDPR